MVTIDDSTFASNIAASDGGGICAVSGSVVALNSTLANNSSSLYGGGIHVGAGVQATFINSTVADNTASEGGGVFTPGAVTMGSTIVADNTGTIAAPDYAGVLATDLGNNLLGNDQYGYRFLATFGPTERRSAARFAGELWRPHSNDAAFARESSN